MKSFDSNLRRLRHLRSMKQEDLALKMNVTRQTVSGWETGRRQPDLETLKRLAEVLDVDIHELIYGNKPGEYPKYQKKYILWTAIFGGTVAVLVLFWLLFFPYFRRLCATYHWGLALLICYEVLPLLGAFSFGALLPSLVLLFVPVRLKKSRARWLLVCGVLALLPAVLFWLGVFPLPTRVLYTVGHAVITYILPFASGICIFLVIGSEQE